MSPDEAFISGLESGFFLGLGFGILGSLAAVYWQALLVMAFAKACMGSALYQSYVQDMADGKYGAALVEAALAVTSFCSCAGDIQGICTPKPTTTSGSGVNEGTSGINSITGQIAKDKPVVVIGESMDRVNPVAAELRQAGYEVRTYYPQNFRSSPGNLNSLDVEANRSWLNYWTQKKGATVIDIGVDPSREARSPFYGVENRSIYHNWNYQNVIKYNPEK